MTPEEQRIKIAEACRWKDVSVRLTEYSERGYETLLGTDPVNSMKDRHVPDYLNDLNAMHEAEKVVMEPSEPALSCPQEPDFYLDNLRKVTGGKLINHEGLTTFSHGSFLPIIHATAAQRSEAFLRTLNLWKD